jgi:ComF family protein
MICFNCRYRLPRTHYHRYRENPVEQLFWGRVPLHAAAAFYFFRKDGRVQRILHQLKYKGAAELGRELGRMYGRELIRVEAFSKEDCIIPVPLSPEKLRIRGFNQSEVFAEGLAQVMGCEMIPEGLEKIRNNTTQTRKSRYGRWENAAGIYRVGRPAEVSGRRILLVDDVVTTGATLESCARTLHEAGASAISIACIAAALRNY